MPLHWLPYMLVAVGFMLWLAFQDGDDAEVLEHGVGAEEPEAGRDGTRAQGSGRGR